VKAGRGSFDVPLVCRSPGNGALNGLAYESHSQVGEMVRCTATAAWTRRSPSGRHPGGFRA